MSVRDTTVVAPPGPRGHFLLGTLPDFARDLLGFATYCARQYGDIAATKMVGKPVWFLNHPDLIEEVLVTQNKKFHKHSFFWRHTTAVFGEGLLTSEGSFWLKQRRLMQPAFHRERISEYGRIMVEYTGEALEGWQAGQVREIHQDMMHLTCRIVCKCLFDTEVSDEVLLVEDAVNDILDEISIRFRRPIRIPDWIPLPGNIRYRKAVQKLENLIYRIIENHRRSSITSGSLLSMLMDAKDEEGNRMSDKNLRDEAITLFLAGHETTALSVSWAFYLLSQNREAEENLSAELRNVLGSKPPTVEDVPKLRFTEWVVMESMRLYPPGYIIGREAIEDCEIAGYKMPTGCTVYMSPWVMHRDERYFANPECFQPERWKELAGKIPKFAYLPFGGGPRLCIGNSFAMLESVLLLATILQRFHLQLANDSPITPHPTITLRPVPEMKMRLRSVE